MFFFIAFFLFIFFLRSLKKRENERKGDSDSLFLIIFQNFLFFFSKILVKVVKKIWSFFDKKITNLEFEKYFEKVVLEGIIRKNEDTFIGKKLKFESVKNFKDFQSIIQLTKFDFYEGIIEDMMDHRIKGEIFFKGPIKCYARTSGTSSKPKLIPVSKKISQNLRTLLPFVSPITDCYTSFSINERKSILFLKTEVRSTFVKHWDGTEISYISTNSGIRKIIRFFSFFGISSPIEAFEEDFLHGMFWHSYFALKNSSIKIIFSMFSSFVLDFFIFLEQNYKKK